MELRNQRVTSQKCGKCWGFARYAVCQRYSAIGIWSTPVCKPGGVGILHCTEAVVGAPISVCFIYPQCTLGLQKAEWQFFDHNQCPARRANVLGGRIERRAEKKLIVQDAARTGSRFPLFFFFRLFVYVFLNRLVAPAMLNAWKEKSLSSLSCSFFYRWPALNGTVGENERAEGVCHARFISKSPRRRAIPRVPRPRPIFNALRFLFALPSTSRHIVTRGRTSPGALLTVAPFPGLEEGPMYMCNECVL